MRTVKTSAAWAQCLAAACVLLFVGCRAEQPLTLKLGYIPVADSAPLYVAEKAGLFASKGLQVELTELSEGSLIAAAAARGDLDGGSAGSAPILNALGRGAPLLIVGDGGHVVDRPRPPVALVGMANSPIRTMKDLVGHKVGYVGPKTIEDALVSVAMQKAGIDRSSVTFVPVPQESKIPLLLRGDLQAVLLVEPYVSEALKEYPTRVILSSQQIVPDFQQALIIFFGKNALGQEARRSAFS